MKILLTGATGQLGRCLQDRLEQTDYEVLAFNRNSLDIADFIQVNEIIKKHSPDVVINAAAYTAVDKAESGMAEAYEVNELGAKNIAVACLHQKIPLIHISTDYVFDGTNSIPYRETDVVNPQSVYGKSKLAGERAIMESQVKYCIIRTSWLFSEHGNNFLKTILRLFKERDKLTIVSDQYGQPTYAGDLSDAIIAILPVIVNKNFSSQIFHFSGNPACSWYDFAREIIEHAILTGILDKEIEVVPITTKEYPTPAPRPMYSVLDCSAIKKFYNIAPSDWKSAVSDVLKKIQENKQP